MRTEIIRKGEVFGLIRPEIDAHTLGITSVAKLLQGCGVEVCIGSQDVSRAISRVQDADNASFLIAWIRSNRITRLGLSYRLDPGDAQELFGRTYHMLKRHRQFRGQGGRLVQIYFAGLLHACKRIQWEYADNVIVFCGDETPLETLRRIGVPEIVIPQAMTEGARYDDDRASFANNLVNKEEYRFLTAHEQFKYPSFGTRKDSLVERIAVNRRSGLPPLMRAHVGPYHVDHQLAISEFNSWLRALAAAGFLDVVSVGTSQLSQSDFGRDWDGRPNGGGVPVNSEHDFDGIYQASRPMLVRTYAGTRDIPDLAEMYERSLNMAWHALSLWWFNQIDGRGPYTVRENLDQHIETLRFIARSGKPYEPNVSHHFAFRGADDYSYALSVYLAARTAKKMGVKYLVLQIMLNTPKSTWGVQDLAKARATLRLVRELEDGSFAVFLQPRAGLDYFSPDLDRAKRQLAAVSALMDDIEPDTELSPDIIHVVSYCEAVALATPDVINESIQITIQSLHDYRKCKKAGIMDDMRKNPEVIQREEHLYQEVKAMIRFIETNMADPYTAEGLYEIFRAGVFPVPHLWHGREEFCKAVGWNTDWVDGGIKVVDELGKPISPLLRLQRIWGR